MLVPQPGIIVLDSSGHQPWPRSQLVTLRAAGAGLSTVCTTVQLPTSLRLAPTGSGGQPNPTPYLGPGSMGQD